MLIIKKHPEENGAHANQRSSANFPVPENWIIIPEKLEDKAAALLPFINLVFDDDGNIADIPENAEAREKAESSRKGTERNNPRMANQLPKSPAAQIESLQAQVSLLSDVLQGDMISRLSPEQIARHKSALQDLGITGNDKIVETTTKTLNGG